MKKHLFGKKLKELRKKAGLTQRELAEQTGLHITTIANYEIDNREPKANQLKILANTLGINVEELLITKADGSRGSTRKYIVAEASVGISNEVIPALVTNISSTGIGLYTDGKLKVQARVILRLKILKNGAMTVTEEVPGRVVWTKLIHKKYASGIRFEKEVNSNDFPVLTTCLKYAALF